MKTFDLVLLYYDKPEILRNWFHRLINFSDFSKFQGMNQRIIIADSGTPENRMDANLAVIREQFEWVRNKILYARAETDEIRKLVPIGVAARPQCHAYNMAVMDLSASDLITTSVIGHIFSPRYFNGHIAAHLLNDRCLVLPKRFDLLCDDYHAKHVSDKWEDLMKMKRSSSGGWPDFSVQRKYFVEIGGWDEYFTFIAPADMDFGSRLTGKLDNGAPSQALFQGRTDFVNYGLDFVQPDREDFISLTCNTYDGHRPKNDPEREKGHEIGNNHYLANWGVIHRNLNRIPVQHTIRYDKKANIL